MSPFNLAMKFAISFAIPFCWLMLLYPVFKRLNKAWHALLILTTILSILLLIFKETVDDRSGLVNDITVYVLGVFFASALIAVAFAGGNRWLRAIPVPGSPLGLGWRATLHSILQAGVMAEAEGRKMYAALSGRSHNERTRSLCERLSAEEEKHRRRLVSWLSLWLPGRADEESMVNLFSEMKRQGIFLTAPSDNASEYEVARYAILQEGKMEAFYRFMIDGFPDMARRDAVEQLAMEEKAHARLILELYPSLPLK